MGIDESGFTSADLRRLQQLLALMMVHTDDTQRSEGYPIIQRWC